MRIAAFLIAITLCIISIELRRPTRFITAAGANSGTYKDILRQFQGKSISVSGVSMQSSGGCMQSSIILAEVGDDYFKLEPRPMPGYNPPGQDYSCYYPLSSVLEFSVSGNTLSITVR